MENDGAVLDWLTGVLMAVGGPGVAVTLGDGKGRLDRMMVPVPPAGTDEAELSGTLCSI